LARKEICDRRLFCYTRRMSWYWEQDVTVNDNCLILNKDTVWMVIISRKNCDLESTIEKGLYVSSVLFFCKLNVRWP